MIQSFSDKGTRDIFEGANSKYARKKLDSALHAIAHRKLDMLNAACTLQDLEVPPSIALRL